MASDKRQRQDAGRQQRLAQQAEQAKRQQRGRSARGFGIVLALVVVLAAGFAIFGGGGDDEETATDASTTTSAADDGTTASTIEVTYPGPGAAIEGDTPCPEADGSSERTTSFTKAPPTCIDPEATYTAVVDTTEGSFTIALDAAKAPIAVNNFVVLARYHYYDDVPFHRIVPGFVDQAGTPVDQAGPDIETNPGYTIPDELPDTSALASPADAYPDGAIAMANRGPDTGSSQFFVVVGGGGAQFASNPNYTVFGQITEGLEVAEAINAFGDGASNGTPTKDVRIRTITITEA